MAHAPHLLIVDDDAHIREVLRYALGKAGFAVDEAPDGAEALTMIGMTDYDLIVLDILMPEKDGIEVINELRRTSEVPVLFLSSKDEEIDRIVGLELGADDYMTKPFSPRELIARVRAILRRPRVIASVEPLRVGALKIDPERREVHWDTQSVSLTATEFSILQLLAGRPGRVFERDELMRGAYPGKRIVSHRTIDSHIRRLRDKLRSYGADVIHTTHGVGYRLDDCQSKLSVTTSPG